MNMLEPIVALATPPIKAALAVIRLTGEGVFDVVSNMFSRKIVFEGKNKILHLPRPREEEKLTP